MGGFCLILLFWCDFCIIFFLYLSAGRGNITACAESNFYHDPEAAFIVLKEMNNITLMPLEVCQRHPLTGVGGPF
jgi:hypothetical protein